MPVGNHAPDRTERAAGQADHALGAVLQPVEAQLRTRPLIRVEIGFGDELNEVRITGLRRGDQHHVLGLANMGRAAAAGARRGEIAVEDEIELAADDWLNPVARRLLREFQRTEQIAAVGNADGRHAVRLGKADDLLQRQRAFEKRIGRVDAQMDEAGRGRSRLLVMLVRLLSGHGPFRSLVI
jgi:hypothetical protein